MTALIQGASRVPSSARALIVVSGATIIALLLSGCAGSGGPVARHTPAKPAGPTGSPASAASSEPVVAVTRKSGALELYGVRDGRTAHLLRTLHGPEGMTASAATLSGGTQPTVCAQWRSTKAGPVECYSWGSDSGTVVPGTETLGYADIALSYTGRSLAWTGDREAGDPKLVYARLTGTVAGPATQVSSLAPGQAPEEAALVVIALAWDGDDALLVSHAYDDDVNGSVARVTLSPPPNGWSNAAGFEQNDQAWPVTYGSFSPTVAGRLLATQLGWVTDGRETMRAVEMDAATGRVLSVVSVAAKDRRMRDVNGGSTGVLYRTEGRDGGIRTYWRAPGQAHGVPLAGIPADATTVVAQP